MIAFAELLERLVFTPARNAKIALLRRYFATQPDPDRGIGLAAITGELRFTAAKPGLIRELAAARTDPVLFDWSYDYVGDLAETVALMWPAAPDQRRPAAPAPTSWRRWRPRPKPRCPSLVAGWLDASDASARLALLKLITGGLRVGASARLAKIALAEIGGVDAGRGGGGLARPRAALPAAVRLAGGPRAAPRSGGPAGVPPADAGASAGGGGHRRAATRRTGAPNGNGTASACSLSPPRAAGGSIRAAPRTSPPRSPRSSRRWISTPCWTASCWWMPRTGAQRRAVRRSAAAAEPQGRDAPR